jgi:hypothetical protein
MRYPLPTPGTTDRDLVSAAALMRGLACGHASCGFLRTTA